MSMASWDVGSLKGGETHTVISSTQTTGPSMGGEMIERERRSRSMEEGECSSVVVWR